MQGIRKVWRAMTRGGMCRKDGLDYYKVWRAVTHAGMCGQVSANPPAECIHYSGRKRVFTPGALGAHRILHIYYRESHLVSCELCGVHRILLVLRILLPRAPSTECKAHRILLAYGMCLRSHIYCSSKDCLEACSTHRILLETGSTGDV